MKAPFIFLFCTWLLAWTMPQACAADPTAEELLKPTRLTLINAGNDLSVVLKEIEKQTGNELIDEASRGGELPAWNFSLSDREFWPLLDKFLDAAELDLDGQSFKGLAIVFREKGRVARHGKAVYLGPFRLEVVQVSSRRLTQYHGEHDASIDLEVAWEPRLRPLMFTQPVSELQLIADGKTPVAINERLSELAAEATSGSYAIELNVPMQLPDVQLSTISSLKGRIKALIPTRLAKFRFDNLGKASNVEQSDGGMKVTLDRVRENQGLCELHMRVEFDEKLPKHVAQGSWNFQNQTYLENAAGEKLEHAGFESTMQAERKLGLAYYFDVPEEKLAEYTWVYEIPAAIVEVPIEFELKDIPLP